MVTALKFSGWSGGSPSRGIAGHGAPPQHTHFYGLTIGPFTLTHQQPRIRDEGH